ncbi:uncharacterized protein N7483_006362 [Penicillium malachiteum]|uniref:uncharacterized protein n=1 Tax=Penicillium malachiteum TaxID=1324776 RepID=UPI002548830B|nr:uncharacterized protein N7483_006362 [Penicillium malachiteum]KAJ5725005.1 hypothetical protein N7483_006362 [Penicillium malachiteum]
MRETKSIDSSGSLHLETVNTTPAEQSLKIEVHDDNRDSVASPDDPRDPRNWSLRKKNAQILMVAFHSMISTFMAAGIIPAYETLAKQYNVTVPEASYLTSFQILLLGLSPLIWNPITAVYGRYNVSLLSVFGSMLCNIGGARCTTYGAQMATRVLTAFLISPPIGIGSGAITELCEPEERGQKLGWWMLLTTIGTPAGPFLMGFVTQHIGIQWIFWIFAIINFVQLLFYLAFGDETVYHPDLQIENTNFFTKMKPRRLAKRKLSWYDFVAPLTLAKSPRILVTACAHAITFCYGNIALIVEMPIAFGEKFNFSAQQIGLQFIAIIIGCVLGEQVSGPGSDWFLKRIRKSKGNSHPSDRLWLAYIAFSTIIAGLLTWGFQLKKAGTVWNVTPCVGAAIASFGNQMQTTILTTFAVESEKERASEVGVFVNVCRQIYGFLGPFYFPYMFAALGLDGAAGIMVVIVSGAALLPIVAVQLAARRYDVQISSS